MRAYIIAEMAWSHSGSLERALQILQGAVRAGADAISIHITDMPTYMVDDYKCLDGTTLSDSADKNASIYSFLDEINLDNEEWMAFDARAAELGIDLVVMCNDQESLKFSKVLNVRHYVLSAASFLEFDLIDEIVRYNSDIILRTGGATLHEVERVVNRIFSTDANAKVNLLAGIQLYPTPIEELHLTSLLAMAQHFDRPGVDVGLADHIDGDHPYAVYLPAIALAYGARMLEKHITTRREEKLEDYEAALGIDQFATFVDYVRTAGIALGTGTLAHMSDNDAYHKYRMVSRKKIVAAVDLAAGTTISRNMLAFKRADHGAQLDQLDELLGRRLAREIKRNEGLDVTDLESG